jgi:hypothetical protein
MKHNPKFTMAVSAGLAGSMFVVALAEYAHGKALSEVHLITPAPITVVSSVGSSSGLSLDPVTFNSIMDAVHATAVPEESELRLGGLMTPRPAGDDTK